MRAADTQILSMQMDDTSMKATNKTKKEQFVAVDHQVLS